MNKIDMTIITSSGNMYKVDSTRCDVIELAKIIMRNKSEFVFVPIIKELASIENEKINIKLDSILINPSNVSEIKGSISEFLLAEKFNK